MSWLRRWALSRLDGEAFCRRLTLEGWEHLVAADSEGVGTVLVSPGDDLWPVTVAAVGLYLGPVDLVARASRSRDLPARWQHRFVRRVLDPEDADGPALEALRDGGRVLILEAPEMKDSAAWGDRLSSETGAAVLSVVTESPRRGRYRLTVSAVGSTG